MKRKVQVLSMLMLIGIALISGCKKDDDTTDDNTPKPTAAKTFMNLTFSYYNAYFATDGGITATLDSTQAKLIAAKIDITYFDHALYGGPYFFDPKFRTQVGLGSDYYLSWTGNSVETKFYNTTLVKSDFDAAKSDQSKIASYFSDTTKVVLSYSNGSQIGEPEMSIGQVIGFKNTLTGKRGFIYIRSDQSQGWPIPFYNTETKVDLIKEN